MKFPKRKFKGRKFNFVGKNYLLQYQNKYHSARAHRNLCALLLRITPILKTEEKLKVHHRSDVMLSNFGVLFSTLFEKILS